MSSSADFHTAISEEVSKVLIGNEDIIEKLSIAILTRGHILLEGVPGVAKTTIANLFAQASGLEYNRIQMTPDILPADITGTHIYREQSGEFVLQRGPVFANVVVADEINRATPKTQSALLESMQERRVSIEGETLPLPDPFIVIATQNPIEMEGTFSLPEAQRDRFMFKLTVDLLGVDDEFKLLSRFDGDPELSPDDINQIVSREDLMEARAEIQDIFIDDKVKRYILALIDETRQNPAISYGASTRASLAFLQAGKAHAAIRDREYVIPDDIKALAPDILRHRLILSTDAELGGDSVDDILEDMLTTVDPPEGDLDAGETQEQAPDGGREPADSEFDFEN